VISHGVSQARQALLEPRIPDRGRTHVDTPSPLTQVERSPDDRDVSLRLRHGAEGYAILVQVAETDRWAAWLAQLRTSGEPDARKQGFDRLVSWRDHILDNAELREGETLLDAGCGEGLVAFGALERGAAMVVFSDVSQDLLDFCQHAAGERGVLHRSRFVRAGVEDLAEIPDASVDVVAMRSVLIYVAAKKTAFAEFFRVLRQGGRVSLFEPINRFAQTDSDTWMGYDLSPVADVARKVRDVFERFQPPETDPMFDFDERDLLKHAEGAGFFPLRLELECRIEEPQFRDWSMLVETPMNPRIPSLSEAMDEALTEGERTRFEQHLRPLVENGRGSARAAHVFMTGVKP
jgi:arsenite methyltransferase